MNEIWPVLSGAWLQERRIEALTNNLANTNTKAFKRDRVFFESLSPISRDIKRGDKTSIQATPTFSIFSQVKTDFSQGAMRVTDEPLDIAVDGDGFFAVQTPQGVRYTRNGNFTLDAQGQIVTQNGFAVLGDGGAIILPPGKVNITNNGKVFVDKEEVATLSTFEFADRGTLKKVGDSLFEAVEGTATPSTEIRVRQGMLEQSNVNPVEDMVAMIGAMRSYEWSQKAIHTVSEIAGKSANEVGRLA